MEARSRVGSYVAMMKQPEIVFGTLKPFYTWLQECGWSKSFGWRMRKRGMVKTVNIAGKHYVSAAEVQRFLDRAEDGQFAKTPRMPAARRRILQPASTGSGRMGLDTTPIEHLNCTSSGQAAEDSADTAANEPGPGNLPAQM